MKPVIIKDLEQGTPEWHATRRGIPTASNFGKIITGTTLKKSASAAKYQRELCGALLGGDPEFQGNKWTDRGTDLEPEARAWYEFEHDATVDEVGFVFGDESKSFGCSPDGFVDVDGGIEIKCPSASVHVEYMLKPKLLPCAYISQVRGTLFVTGREYWDFVSYYPGVRPVVIRTFATDTKQIEWVDAFKVLLAEFLKDLEAMKTKLGIVTVENVDCPW